MTWQAKLRRFDDLPPDGTLVLAVRRNPDEPFSLARYHEGDYLDEYDLESLTDVAGWYALPPYNWRDLPSYPMQLSGGGE
jgi:hypothetical protein